MSYRREFTKQVEIRYSGTVSYPASQDGGSVSYSGTAIDDITVSVLVDTESFDGSINDCNDQVNLLTGAVAVSEASQVESVRHTSRQIGKSIISGFFKTLRSDISQQIAELRNKVDSTLLHLQSTGQRCLEKQQQMGMDYNLLKQRYTHIFDDLDNELRNSIHELDKAAFQLRQVGDKNSFRAITDDLVGTAVISSSESRRLEAQISASKMKKSALATIKSATGFLERQQTNDAILDRNTFDENKSACMYMPVCMFEADNGNGKIDHEIFQPDGITPIDETTLREGLNGKKTKQVSTSDMSRIREYFFKKVYDGKLDGTVPQHDPHYARVIVYMNKLFNENNVETY